MPQVNVVFFEDPIEVDEDEAQSLARQGLLREPPAAKPSPPARPAENKE